jgi:hypothetical protein
MHRRYNNLRNYTDGGCGGPLPPMLRRRLCSFLSNLARGLVTSEAHLLQKTFFTHAGQIAARYAYLCKILRTDLAPAAGQCQSSPLGWAFRYPPA